MVGKGKEQGEDAKINTSCRLCHRMTVDLKETKCVIHGAETLTQKHINVTCISFEAFLSKQSKLWNTRFYNENEKTFLEVFSTTE